MRLFLIPVSTGRTLVYCKKVSAQVTKPSILDRITNKASATWGQWEEAEKGWKKLLVSYGHRAFQRIPYEEWGLKSVPPLSARREAQELQADTPVEVLYPRNVIHHSRVLQVLRKLATERQDLHRKRMWWSLIAAPFTAPVALIPLIPNIPFFYLAYRGWSHWRALSGSKHLEFLLDRHLVTPISLPDLERVYSNHRAVLAESDNEKRATAGETIAEDDPPPTNAPHNEKILLEVTDGKKLAKMLQAPELVAEVERAVAQVQHLLDQKKKQS